MKKLLLIVVVAALALTLVPLALAGAPGGGGWKNGHAKFNLIGKVTAVTAADATVDPPVSASITVKVKAGSHIKDIRGTEAMFVVAADVPVWQLTEDGAVAMTLSDVAAGDWVKIKGKIAKAEDGSKIYTVKSIKYRDLTPEPAPEPSTPPVAQ